MMADKATALGIARSIEISGKKWKFAPLTEGDKAEFEEWSRPRWQAKRDRRLDELIDALKAAEIPPADRLRPIQELLDEEMDVDTIKATPDGSNQIFLLSLRQHDKHRSVSA